MRSFLVKFQCIFMGNAFCLRLVVLSFVHTFYNCGFVVVWHITHDFPHQW